MTAGEEIAAESGDEATQPRSAPQPAELKLRHEQEPQHQPAFQEALQWIAAQEEWEQQQQQQQPPACPASQPVDAAAQPLSTSPSASSSAFRDSRAAKKLRLKQVKSYLCISRAHQHQPLSSLLSILPTPAVFVHGAGASCGVSYDDCLSAFSRCGEVQSLTMIGFLPFVLIVFSSVDAAIACRARHHRQRHRDACGHRLLYVEFARLDASSLLSVSSPSPLLLPNASSSPPQCLPSIPGLVLVQEFISAEEERRILCFLHSQPFTSHKFRSVQHYGYAFDYERCDVEPEMRAASAAGQSDIDVFPPVFHDLVRRFRSIPSWPAIAAHRPAAARESEGEEPAVFVPDQLTVNRYLPGDGIAPHVDVHSSFTDIVLSLSLSAPIVMDIIAEPLAAAASSSAVTPAVPLLLPPRSLLVLAHYARYGVHHAIQARKTDRIDGRLMPRQERLSMTWRRRRDSGHCSCQWPELCDTALGVRKKDKMFK